MVWMWVEREMTLRAMVVGMLVVWAMGARGQSRSVSEQYLFSAANAERVQRGLPELRWDDALYRAAERHAQEMAARREYFASVCRESRSLAMRGKAAGAKFSVMAENVAEASTAVVIHDAWMNSPGHRANLLDPQVNAVGISVVRRDGQLYAVQDFERTVVALSFDGAGARLWRQLVERRARRTSRRGRRMRGGHARWRRGMRGRGSRLL